jgi:tetratricopeptide (TPR) repeat protein
MSASIQDFVEKGETAFKAGNYEGAVYAWRHAAVDDPQNGLLTMMLGQALFATGKYEEAAGATQAAMHHLSKDQWGVVVTHYTQLYGRTQDYTNQLRALEKAMKAKGDDPALRFLTGFQYAYLGFVDQAIDQLDRAIKLAPRDEMAKQLRNEMRAKQMKPAAIPPLPGLSSGPALQPTPRDSDEE